jgi:hypothetical protein
MRRAMICCLAVAALLVAPTAGLAQQKAKARCNNGKSTDAAMWYSIAHPGLGEWYLNGWGSMNANAPQKKFWLGWIPLYGWPGYLQVKSAIDAKNCRTNDELSWPK